MNSKLSWRLIPLLRASGQIQMAIDRWLLEKHQAGEHPPVLRFYTWASPTISLGYHQKRWPPSWQQLSWQETPIQLVRRPTGGRAVLHQGDLTYMVVTSGLTGKRLDAYKAICEFLIRGWRSLGVNLHYGSAGREYAHNPSCFGTATGADLVSADGYKLIGSAQLRRGHAILQHGSMRLEPDADLLTQVFGEPVPPPITLATPEQGEALIQSVIHCLTHAAADYFDVEIVQKPLSDEEWQAILTQPTLEVGLPEMLHHSPRSLL
ncbi:MAG TPA: biotin--protein ligase [Cyanobacteria bacterium UBA8543]|nr:biotin--protein ligase [Cyanobacteria bacterium UBA8543]